MLWLMFHYDKGEKLTLMKYLCLIGIGGISTAFRFNFIVCNRISNNYTSRDRE